MKSIHYIPRKEALISCWVARLAPDRPSLRGGNDSCVEGMIEVKSLQSQQTCYGFSIGAPWETGDGMLQTHSGKFFETLPSAGDDTVIH